MRFRHLEYPPSTPVERLGTAAIDDILERGDLEAWAPIARAVRADPWGGIAGTVLRLCEAHPMYGTSALWREWIESLRRRHEGTLGSWLAELRARARCTQQQIADRMGISQSDVSKLERRSDAKLSTIRSYAEAIAGTVELAVRLNGQELRYRPGPARDTAPQRRGKARRISPPSSVS